jgi:Icc-related predicted phosphoesterase
VAGVKLWILSDLHLSPSEARAGTWPHAVPDADVAVVAGDVCEGVEEAIGWLQRSIAPHMPVVFVLGNHEFFGEYLEEGRRVAWARAAVGGVHLLDDTDVTLGGVRFLGSTLWTDYRLGVGDDPVAHRQSMRATERLADHREIMIEPKAPGQVARTFRPRDALALHAESVDWLDGTLGEPFAGPTVVISHHAPHRGSIAAQWMDDPLTPAFVSDLSGLIERRRPDLWVHGHTHASFDHQAGGTRIVCNPKESNSSFGPGFVVEV